MKRSRFFLMLVSARVALFRERRYSRALESQLEGEKARNQSREDELITVPMRMLGLYGVATREGPAPQVQPLRRQTARRSRQVAQASPWAMLTDNERAEWPLYLADADPDGLRVQQVKREFLQMIEQRRATEAGEVM
jgi:hypothetical protein